MATRSQANNNNFIRWDKITGNLTTENLASTGIPDFIENSDGIENWISANAAESNSWAGVVYGNSLFVAVASSGANRVMTSYDAINWTSQSASEANAWNEVTFGGGLFVAVASTGTNRIMTSPDGSNWTSRSVTANTWTAIAYGNGTFVALASAGTNRAMTSPDGITWTDRAISANTWTSIAYGNGLFVAIGTNGGTEARIATSPDGITWTDRAASNNSSWQRIAFGNGVFVAVANVSFDSSGLVTVSSDGVNWEERQATSGALWGGIAYGNQRFVAVSTTDEVMYSEDNGQNWIPTLASENANWSFVTSGGGLFVSVASSGSGVMYSANTLSPTKYISESRYDDISNVVVTAFETQLISWYANLNIGETSDNFDLWTLSLINSDNIIAYDNISELRIDVRSFSFGTWNDNAATDNTSSWEDVTFGNDRFVAVSDSGIGFDSIMYSDDGENWTVSGTDLDLVSVTYGGGLFVIASGGTPAIYTSPDGIIWTARTATAGGNNIDFGNGTFVVVGNNHVKTSPDGITWTDRNPAEANNWQDVAYGNGIYVAVSSNGTNRIMTSVDGIVWQSQAESTGGTAIAYGNGIFVFTSNSYAARSTDNGVTWTQISGVSGDTITYGNGLFVSINNSIVYYSTDGSDWQSDSPALTSGWAGIVYGNGNFVSVSSAGAGNRTMIVSLSTQFNFYNEYVPSDIQTACYRMIIYNENNVIIYISNEIKFSDTIAPFTFLMRFRNSENILNFNYSGTLSSFFNQFRIDLFIRQPQFPTQRKGYELIDGSFQSVRTTRGTQKQFLVEAYQDDDHEAFGSATIHSNFQVFENGQWVRYVRNTEEPTIEWTQNFPLADGSVNMERRDTFSSSDNV